MSRDKVLEQAAKLCDELAASYSACEVSFVGSRSDGLFAEAAKECAAKIHSHIPPPAGYNELIESLLVEGSRPSIPHTKGLVAPTMETAALLGHQIYKDQNTGDYWVELAWINYPATCLRNLRTGDNTVEVIGCLHADRFVAIGRIESSKLPRT